MASLRIGVLQLIGSFPSHDGQMLESALAKAQHADVLVLDVFESVP